MSHAEIDRAKTAKVKQLRLSISRNGGRLIHNTYVKLSFHCMSNLGGTLVGFAQSSSLFHNVS